MPDGGKNALLSNFVTLHPSPTLKSISSGAGLRSPRRLANWLKIIVFSTIRNFASTSTEEWQSGRLRQS